MVGLHALFILILQDPFALCEALRTLDAGRRQAALAALGPPAVETLCRALEDKFPELEKKADEMVSRLDDPDPAVREKATEELIGLGGRVVPLVEKRLDKAGSEGRWRLTRVLGWAVLEDRRQEELELGTLQKAAACEALGAIGEARAAGALLGALGHADWRIRREALQALGRLKAPEAAAPMIKLLAEDPDVRMRALGAAALARIGSPEARAALRVRLEKESDGQVVRRLLEALTEDPSAEAARAMIRTLESPDPMIRAAALELLAARTKLAVTADPRRPVDPKPFRAWWEATFGRPWE